MGSEGVSSLVHVGSLATTADGEESSEQSPWSVLGLLDDVS